MKTPTRSRRRKSPPPKPPLPPEAGEEGDEGGRGREGQSAFSVYLKDPLAAALRKYVAEARPRTTNTGVFEAAVEVYLEARGYWARPAPATPDQSTDPA